jgi:uncharacterized protein (DUF2235 family)
MKRIVICYDGTWNAVTDPGSVTNVVRLGQAVRKVSKKDGKSQMVYYNAGVGSDDRNAHPSNWAPFVVVGEGKR